MSALPAVVVARRTPFTTVGRALADVPAADLAAAVLARAADEMRRLLGPDHPPVDDVLLGNCRGPGGNLARVAALAAGLGDRVPGVTIDRQCGSGLEAIRLGAALIAAGQADVVLAAGVESSSLAPGGPTVRARFTPEGRADPDMGVAADDAAAARGISRDRQDRYAARSHARAVAAQQDGRFAAELVPVAGVMADDRPRAGLSPATLARFRPAFGPDGTATVGNTCPISDGAAAVVLVSEPVRARAGLPGLRILGSAVVGADPALPALAAAPAVRAVLDRTGVRLDDLAVLEITEAFAGQVLVCTDELGLDPLGPDDDRICPDGGAIALGHPWSASGAALMVRLFSRLVRAPSPPGRFGVAGCAIGGGQGLAVVVERVG